MSVKERIIQYIDFKEMSKSAFCREIDVSPAYITSMRKSIQPDKIESIAMNFPDLNIDWLLTGRGEMIRADAIDGTLKTVQTLVMSSIDKNDIIDMMQKKIDELNSQIEEMLTTASREADGNIIASQQRIIESLSKTIENLTNK